MLPIQGEQVWSLARKLRSYMAKKKKKNQSVFPIFIGNKSSFAQEHISDSFWKLQDASRFWTWIPCHFLHPFTSGAMASIFHRKVCWAHGIRWLWLFITRSQVQSFSYQTMPCYYPYSHHLSPHQPHLPHIDPVFHPNHLNAHLHEHIQRTPTSDSSTNGYQYL